MASEAIPQRAQLLVSVRTAREAAAALCGGADIIDVKEPVRGPLGMADVAVINEVACSVSNRVPVSAALGEVSEWLSRAGAADSAGTVPALPAGLSFAKLGLAATIDRDDWVGDWMRVRAAFEFAAGYRPTWVAVGYADAQVAGAPPIGEVIATASQTGCLGVLIDTYDKSSGSLLQQRTPAELEQWGAQARGLGLFFAVAGRLREEDLNRRRISDADIVGVRSSACAGADRNGEIDAGRVAALKHRIVAECSSPV